MLTQLWYPFDYVIELSLPAVPDDGAGGPAGRQ
jgi:hypothetical protein